MTAERRWFGKLPARDERSLLRLFIALLVGAAAFMAFAPPSLGQPLEPSEAESFEELVDSLIIPMMEENKAIGLTVAVVQDGAVKHLKGYGYADRESETAVDPQRHLFRIASITKTVTATAVMQLVEQGRIDPEADVNDYLTDFKIPEAFGGPVKIKDLLSHRGGFEDQANFIYAGDPSEYRILRDYLAETVPARVYPSGERTSYSNWGYSLLGRVVENVSGKSWEDYFADHIFDPLGMNATTARQPLGSDNPASMEPALESRLASIYRVDGEGHTKWRYELLLAAPGGSISSTAADMARFMMAHLNDGALGDERILKPESAASMRQRIYSGRPGVDYGYGFRLLKIGQYDVIRHDGGIANSKSMMIMVPALNTGVFISSNGARITTLMYDVAVDLVKALAGDVVDMRAPVIAMSAAEAEAFTGAYLSTSRAYTNARRLFDVFDKPTLITLGPNSTLNVEASWKGGDYARISERGFQNPESGDIIAFDLDTDGRAIHFYNPGGSVARERMTWRTDRRYLFAAVLTALLFSASRIVAAIVGAARRREHSRTARALNGTAVVAALLLFGAAAAFAMAFSAADSLGRDLWHQWPSPYVSLALTLTTGLAGLSAVMVAGLIPAFSAARMNAGSIVHYSAFTAALAVLVIMLHSWSLVGFNY